MSRYLNTDLDIESREDLGALVPVFKEKCSLLHAEKLNDGKWMLRVEAARFGIEEHSEPNPTSDLEEMLHIIDSLDDRFKRMLRDAETFDFNIGWESGTRLPPDSFRLPVDLLELIATVGATLTVTIYPTEEAYEKVD